ncbi:phosphate/phosphite/phosphonate ABC transporter substrate-binding protein [Macrococcus capreoli]
MLLKKLLTASLLLLVIGGCNNNVKTDTYKPKTLKVQFVPSQNAETLEAKAKPLGKLLSKELDMPVEVSIATSYNTIVEALRSKQADVAFLPPTAYVLAHDKKAADVVLKALHETDINGTKKVTDYYRGQFVVNKNSSIDSIDDINGKRIALQESTSTSGYLYPVGLLKDHNIDVNKDVKSVMVKGHDKAITALINKEVDVAATFQDARDYLEKDYPRIKSETRIIATTEKIPNDTISVQSQLDRQLKEKVKKAFITLSKDDSSKKIIKEIYSHDGYAETKDSEYDIIRKYVHTQAAIEK